MNWTAVVLALKANWDTRRAREGPPPRYHGPRQGDSMESSPRNAATCAERQASRACFGCTRNSRSKGPFRIESASTTGGRLGASRVLGSGREALGPLAKRRN